MVKKFFIRPTDPGNFHKVTRNMIFFCLGLTGLHIFTQQNVVHIIQDGRKQKMVIHTLQEINWKLDFIWKCVNDED